MKFLVVGLGNIGADYAGTRHNIGFDVVDQFAAKHKAVFAPGKHADIAYAKVKGRTFVLVKPSTYMNLSGKAVNYWLQSEKIPLENCLIITDDIALPLGKIRIRPKGSDGGHNGLKHILEVIGHENWARMRFGVGNDYPKGRQVEFVLGRWEAAEKEILEKSIPKAVEAIECMGFQGLEKAMNLFNK